MAYLKINDINFSMYCNKLKVDSSSSYTAQTNAAGDTVVDYINRKRKIEVGIIPLEASAMLTLQNEIKKFGVILTFLNPETNALESVNCIIPANGVEYYTIQINKVLCKAMTLNFQEL